MRKMCIWKETGNSFTLKMFKMEVNFCQTFLNVASPHYTLSQLFFPAPFVSVPYFLTYRYSSALKIEAVNFSDMSIYSYQSRWHHNRNSVIFIVILTKISSLIFIDVTVSPMSEL